MYCSNCGTKYDDGFLFCPSCGAKNTLTSDISGNIENDMPSDAAADNSKPFGIDFGEELTQKIDKPLPPFDDEMPKRDIPQVDTGMEGFDFAQFSDDALTSGDDPGFESVGNTPYRESSRYDRRPDEPQYRDNGRYDRQPDPFADHGGYGNGPAHDMPYMDSDSFAPPFDEPSPYRYSSRGDHFSDQPARYRNDRQQGYGYAEPNDMRYAPRGRSAPQRNQPAAKRRTQQKPSAGMKVLSVFLTIFMFLFGVSAITIASFRIGLNEENMRSICRSGSLSELTVKTEDGEVLLVDMIANSAVDLSTNESVKLDSAIIKKFLDKQSTNTFIEDLAAEYSNYFLNGTAPTKLNPNAVGALLEEMRTDIQNDSGFSFSDGFIEDVKNRMNDGDLSFLSIDNYGGGFLNHYGFNPKLISIALSKVALIICTAAAVLMMILLFLINSKDISDGFRENGSNLIAIGVFNFFVALSSYIISMISNIYIFTGILKNLAITMGVISICVIIAGVMMLVIKHLIKKNAD